LGYYTFIYQVQRDLNGEIESIAIIATEVTQQAELNQKIQKSEKLLRETKEQLELTFANVPASIFLYNNQKEILFANERAANMLGYNTVEELLSYKYYNILMKKGMQDFYVQNENNEFFGIETLPTSNALKSKMQGEMVFSMQNKLDGNKIWYLNKSAPILDTNGGVSMVLTTSTDITAQKLAEETIRDSENRFRLLSDNAPMWVWITDLDINVLYANHELLNYIGLNHYSEFTGKVWQQVVHPDDITIVNENFKKSIVEQTTFDFEVRILNAKTEQFEWFYLKGIPKYENEEFIGFIGTGINIHHQKIHLFALEESEQRFKYLVETLPQMVCVMDENGISEYVTNKWEKYTGIKPGEGLKTWVKIVHPDDLEYSNSIWLDSLKSGSIYKFDLRLKSKEGEYRWFSVNGEPVFDADDKIIKWVSAFTDIHTEKSFSQELEKQVSERTNELLISNELMLQKNDLLRISENFNRSLTDISPNIVYIQDILEDKPFFLNSTYLTFTGYNWQQVKALGDGFMREVIHPDDYDFISETIEKIKVSKVGEIFEAKSLIKNDKGIWVPFLNRLTAFKRDKDQNVIQVIGVAIDISELKGAEKILEQKNEELLKMNKELESFAYVSSHDLQEPLRKIQTFTSRIMEKEYDNLSETGQNYLNRMRLAAERMQQLINDLLAYSRTKVQERKFESTDLSLIVKEVEDDLRDDLAKKNGQIIIIDSYKADVIPFQFRQLMYNLVSNSIKFAKSDEDLNVKVKFEVIKGFEANNDKLIEEKEYCHISISDNGIGFDSSYKDKIFEIFQRLHGREEYTGTGIGLAIVKKIVDNHNGVITADGELGKGATFHIYIPI
jgi:PAS domain S-box-containing protein